MVDEVTARLKSLVYLEHSNKATTTKSDSPAPVQSDRLLYSQIGMPTLHSFFCELDPVSGEWKYARGKTVQLTVEGPDGFCDQSVLSFLFSFTSGILKDLAKRFPDSAIIKAFKILVPKSHSTHIKGTPLSKSQNGRVLALIKFLSNTAAGQQPVFHLPPRAGPSDTPEVRDEKNKARAYPTCRR